MSTPQRDAVRVTPEALPAGAAEPVDTRRWYRQLDRQQWKAFWAAFLGWVLDGFDFTILTFILIDIQKSFTVDAALAGALGTVTLLFRLLGGALAGAAADRWGRKLPLMLSIAWFSLFAFLSGFSTSYAMLFALRALFGIGMGGEWAAGMPLALEHWPARLRGIASGLLQGGYSWGFILSAFMFSYVYPLFEDPEIAWRSMLWAGVLPALLVLWIRTGVQESPVWLAQRRAAAAGGTASPSSVGLHPFQRRLLPTTAHCSILVGAFMVSYYSITYWYPTWLRELAVDPFRYLVALNLGGIAGSALWGRLSETALGRRGAVSCGALLSIAALPLYLTPNEPAFLLFGALLMGIAGPGMWGIVPAYLNARFPIEARGFGAGFAYHMGAALGSVTPFVIGGLRDGGTPLATAMGMSIAISVSVVVGLIWLGPENRGE
jgi:MFS transporter, SHS family, lactate transporter